MMSINVQSAKLEITFNVFLSENFLLHKYIVDNGKK